MAVAGPGFTAAGRDPAGARRRLRHAALAVAMVGLATCQSHDAPKSSPVATVALTASAVIVAPLGTLTVTAVPRDSAGNAITGRDASWTSSQPAVATVDNNGVVTGIAGGSTTLTATIDGVTASVTIYVSFPPPPPPPPPPPQPPPTTIDTVGLLGSWTLVLNRPITSKYEAMSFPDAKHGWVVSDQGDILATADSGVTWTLQASGLGPLRSVDFLDDARGFAGTVLGVLYRTTDGGATWSNITSSLPITPIGFCGITHVGNRVYMVGRYIGATDYFTSDDGGVTWSHTSLKAQMAGLVDVAFLDQSTGFIGGTGVSTGLEGAATILKTTDGGLSWRTVFTDAAGPGWAWKIYPVTSSVIYAAIESDDSIYRVLKSVDGGETWAIQIVATGQRPTYPEIGLQGIGFLDINVGWVGGFFTGMFATTNGGLTWSPVPVASGLINRYRRVGSTLFTAGTQGVLRYDAHR